VFAFTIEDCERLARGKRQLLECKTAIYAGDVYDPGITTAVLSSVSYWLIGLAAVLVVAMLGTIASISENTRLTGRQKFGYILGVVVTPFEFIPAYLIFAPDFISAPKKDVEAP